MGSCLHTCSALHAGRKRCAGRLACSPFPACWPACLPRCPGAIIRSRAIRLFGSAAFCRMGLRSPDGHLPAAERSKKTRRRRPLHGRGYTGSLDVVAECKTKDAARGLVAVGTQREESGIKTERTKGRAGTSSGQQSSLGFPIPVQLRSAGSAEWLGYHCLSGLFSSFPPALPLPSSLAYGLPSRLSASPCGGSTDTQEYYPVEALPKSSTTQSLPCKRLAGLLQSPQDGRVSVVRTPSSPAGLTYSAHKGLALR